MASKAPNARVQATVQREANRLSSRMDRRYEKSLVVHSAISAGHNQVQIQGNTYPAEGVDGQGGALNVVNVGTPAVARYAPPNNKSVIATSGSGRGGGGGGGGGSGGGAVPSPHDLSGSHHSGSLAWSLLNKAGSNLAELNVRSHNDLTNITANQHHSQQHALLGSDHTISGATPGLPLVATSPTTATWQMLKHTDLDPTSITPNQHHNEDHRLVGIHHFDSGLTNGYVIRAYSASGYQWDQLQHNDLGGVTVDQHHPWMHDIITGNVPLGQAHTIAGAKWSMPGAVAVNTLGLIVPSSAPGAAEALLRTDIYGGIQLDTNLLYVDGANNRVGVNIVPAAALDVRSSAVSDITHRIKQIAGQLGRLWRIEDVAGNELIVLDSVGNLQSGTPGFVSGLRGWQITPGGNAEFNNLWARGELHATVFVKDEVHATGGTLIVATAGVLREDAEIDAATTDDDELWVHSSVVGDVPLNITTTSGTFVGNTLHISGIRNILLIDDPASGPGSYFQPGEIIRVKTEIPSGIADLWMEVMYSTQDSGFSRYSVVKRSGTDATIPKGSGIVSYGKPGDGRILLTSDWRNDEGYSPYLDVFTTGVAPWDANDPTGIIPRLRLGQLKGVGVQGVSGISQYGLIASDDLSNTNAGYIIASNLQLGIYRVPFRVNDGVNDTGLWLPNGNLRIGKNIANDATTGFRVFTTAQPGGGAGDVIIGNTATGNFLKWDQFNGVLTVQGTLIVSDPGGTVTLAQVNALDNIVRTDALGYASNAQTGAQNYYNGLRVLKVMGSWTPGAGVLTWGTLTLYLSNGTSRTIASRSSQAISVTSYLYADLAAAGTLSMIVVTDTAQIPSANYVLIAIAQPAAAPGSTSTSIVTVDVMAGITLISGGSIVTGTIRADHIAAGSIGTGHLDAFSVTAAKIAADVYTTAGSKRVMVVDGVFTTSTTTPNLVSWTGLRLLKADSGAPVTIANGSATVVSGQTYFYIRETDASGCTLLSQPDTNFAAIDPNAIMVATATYTTGAKSTTVVMAMGGVIIAGDNIKAGTINADRIVADTITSTQLAPSYETALDNQINAAAAAAAGSAAGDAQVYSDSRRVVGVSGTWTVVDGNTISWGSPTAVTVKFANGTARSITAETGHSLSGGAGTRHYLYVTMSGTGSMTMIDTTVLTNIGVNQALIAVVDVGTLMASISVVAGSTYISGGNIMTQSIVANNIAVNAILADRIAAGQVHASHFDADVYTAMGNRRVLAISGTFNNHASSPNTVIWSQLVIQKADDTQVVVNASAAAGQAISARTYFFVNFGVTGTTTVLSTTTIANISPDAIVIAVVDRGATSGKVSITMVNGGTYLSGDGIVAQSIVAGNIAANQITVDKLLVGTLGPINGSGGINNDGILNTGNLNVNGTLTMAGAGIIHFNANGKLYSGAKDDADSPIPGFFMGREGGFYKFSIGDEYNYFKWDGDSIDLAMAHPLIIQSSGPNSTVLVFISSDRVHYGQINFNWESAMGQTVMSTNAIAATVFMRSPYIILTGANISGTTHEMIRFQVGSGIQKQLRYDGSSGILTYNGDIYNPGNAITARYIQIAGTGPSFRIQNSIDPQNATDGGTIGEIGWSDNRLFVKTTQGWRYARLEIMQ